MRQRLPRRNQAIAAWTIRQKADDRGFDVDLLHLQILGVVGLNSYQTAPEAAALFLAKPCFKKAKRSGCLVCGLFFFNVGVLCVSLYH